MLKGQMAEIPFFPLLRLRAAVAQAHSIQFWVIAAVLAAAALVLPHFRGVQGTLRLYRHHKETMAAVVHLREVGVAAVLEQLAHLEVKVAVLEEWIASHSREMMRAVE